MKLGIFASGNGSNLQAIIDAIKESRLVNTVIEVVISNNVRSNALRRAHNAGIPTYYIGSFDKPLNEKMIDSNGLEILKLYNVDLIVLAGYLKKIGPMILKEYVGKIINIHPALLPKYGGKGMYGDNVHRVILKAKEKTTGVTIHWVDKEYDKGGEIINQIKIPVLRDDNIKSLKNKVLKIEHEFIIEELIKIEKRRAKNV